MLSLYRKIDLVRTVVESEITLSYHLVPMHDAPSCRTHVHILFHALDLANRLAQRPDHTHGLHSLECIWLTAVAHPVTFA
jgi:hypothetical protein